MKARREESKAYIKTAGEAEARGKSFKAEELPGGSCPAAVWHRGQQEPVEQRSRGHTVWNLPCLPWVRTPGSASLALGED